MNLFIDDLRPTPKDDNYKTVRTYEDAIFYIKMTNIDFCSCDYNLGEEKTGLDILKKMVELNKFPKHLNIHSSHITGQFEMMEFAQNNFPKEVQITMNTL